MEALIYLLFLVSSCEDGYITDNANQDSNEIAIKDIRTIIDEILALVISSGGNATNSCHIPHGH